MRVHKWALLWLVSTGSGTLGQQQQQQSQTCERLKRSLQYTQEKAPRDLSGILPIVVTRMNQELEGVLNVEVGYHGDDLQAKVGEHIVKCEVTRLASVVQLPEDELRAQSFVDEMGRQVISQCFEVPFTITDTNECTLRKDHPLRHQCQSPAQCVNTDGSYHCVCPKMGQDEHQQKKYQSIEYDDFWQKLAAEERSPWEVAYNTSSRTSCPSQPSTYGCCPIRTNTKDAMECRRRFRCPQDPCESTSSNDCAASATCVRHTSPNLEPRNYKCRCPTGLMGNGHTCRPGVDPKPEPKVRFDGVTPTEETIQNNFYCDCTTPTVDACSGFPPCSGKHEICVVSASNVPRCGCKPGYVMHEQYGCVDEKPPIMKLRNDPNGDQTLRLKQGDVYKEDAVDIQDENAEEYMRSLKIAYSIPLPHGCLTNVGEFHVNYTIATPWTSPSFVRLTRRVIIEDLDECTLDVNKYQADCPALIPKCDTESGAKCVNKHGSYTCKCPKFTTGDGFLSGLTFAEGPPPHGFKGGTGCRDTSKPVIELKGPFPKTFRIAQCGVLHGVMGSKVDERDADLKTAQQKYYEEDIKNMIRRTAGAELCATHNFVRPNASDCVKAYDDTYKGRVDLSREVAVGDPVMISALQWRVPYDVKDAAGNEAETVWRTVVVEEVVLGEVEDKIRREALEHKNTEIQNAVDRALVEERRKGGSRRSAPTPKDCPACPPCDCPHHDSFDLSMCNDICDNLPKTCGANNGGHDETSHSSGVQLILALESIVPAPIVTVVVFLCIVFTVILFLQYFMTFLFSPTKFSPQYDVEEREKGMQSHIKSFTPQQQQQQNGTMQQPQTPLYGAQAAGGSPSVFGSPPPSQGPPTISASLYGRGQANIFTPPPRPFDTTPRQQPQPQHPQENDNIDIYERSPVITPHKRGEGVRQRSNR